MAQTATRKPKPKNATSGEHKTKTGTIPLEHFGNDVPYGKPVDQSPGSTYDKLKKQTDEILKKLKANQ